MAYISAYSGEELDNAIERINNLQTELNALKLELQSNIDINSQNIIINSNNIDINTDNISSNKNNIELLNNKIIPISQGGSGVTTQLEAMNIFNGNYYKATWELSGTITTGQSKDFTFTSHGRPIFLAVSSCIQSGTGTGSNCWITMELHRDGVGLKSNTQVVEGSKNQNATLVYLDIVPAGTHTYTFKFQVGSGDINFAEVNLLQPNTQPEIIIFEI